MKLITNSIKMLILTVFLLGTKTGQAQCAANFTQSINPGGVVTFTSTSTLASSVSTVYYWTFGNGISTYTATGSAGMYPSYTYTANGTYTVTLFILSTVPSCSNAIQHTINITTAGTNTCNLGASFTFTQVGSGTTNFQSTSSGTVSGTTFSWNFGDNTTGTGPNPSHTYTANGFYVVTLVANNNFSYSCTGTVQVGVNVNAFCNLNANFTSSNNGNGNVSFTNLTTPTTSANSYTWNFGNSSTSNLTNPNVTYTANGTYTVTLSAHTNTPSCNSSTTAVITITNAGCGLTANFTTSQGSNGLVNFYNTSSGTVSGTTYTWNFGNGQTSNAQSPSNTYTANGSYVVTLTANNNGTLTCTSTKTLNIFVNTICNLVAGFNYTLGSNGSVQFGNASTGTSTFSSYFWNFGDASTSTLVNPSHTYANGTYTVMLIASSFSNTCTDTAFQVITVTSNTCVANSTFTLLPTSTPKYWNAIPSSSTNISAAQWSWGDGSTSNTLFTSHLYSISATYTICLSVTVTCGASSTYCSSYFIFKPSAGSTISDEMLRVDVIPEGTTGIKAFESNLTQISVYPNPNNGDFKLSVSGLSTSSDSRISIVNLLGEEVYASDVKTTSGSMNSEIHLGNIAGGIYFVKIDAGAKPVIQKIIINK